MKRGEKIALGLVAGFGCVAGAMAIVNDGNNPYESIVERNIFALKEPPTPVNTTETPPPANVAVTGIYTSSGRKKVLLEWLEPSVPGKPATPKKYDIMSEGQRSGQIEVLQIDEKSGSVKINNYGAITTVRMTTNAPLSMPSANVPALPAVGGVPTIPVPAYGSVAGVSSGSSVTTVGARQIPSRQLRLPPSLQQPAAPVQMTQPAQPSITPEESAILLELEREKSDAQVKNGTLPPLPPLPPK